MRILTHPAQPGPAPRGAFRPALLADAPAPPAPPPAPAVVASAAQARFRALSTAHRERLALAKQAQADAARGVPGAAASFAGQAAAHVAWLAEQARLPAHAAYGEFFDAWLQAACDLHLAAHPLPDRAARQARYAALDRAFQADRGPAERAMLAAAARELTAGRPAFAPGAPSAAVREALAPAIGHLARSRDPEARALARRIEAGEIPFKVTKGGHLGVQYYAMVAVSGITVSNGAVGPDFFALSPPYQAAVLRHEYTHVVQKGGVAGYARAMGGNLVQRLLALAARLPFVDGDRLEALGRRWNGSEQEAYRAEKAFLAEVGWGDRGMLPPDAGMLDGVDAWLEAAAP